MEYLRRKEDSARKLSESFSEIKSITTKNTSAKLMSHPTEKEQKRLRFMGILIMKRNSLKNLGNIIKTLSETTIYIN